MPQKRTERSRSGRGCTVTTEPSHHRYSLPPVHRHHHHHHLYHRSVRHHHHYDGDTKTMIMMVLMTWLSHSSGSWCSWREPARQVLRNILDFILTTFNFWLNDSLISFLGFYILFHLKIKALKKFRFCTLVWTIFLTNDFLIFSVCQGSEQKTAGWWLKVISISTIARKLCAGGSAHFLKIQISSKCIILNSGSRSMCLQIFRDFKSNVDFWIVMKIILQKEKKQFSLALVFFGR